MKKVRLFCLVLVFSLVLCMPTSLMAAESPGIPSPGVIWQQASVTPKNTDLISLPIAPADSDAIKAYWEEHHFSGALVDVQEIKLWDYVTEDYRQPGTPVTVPIWKYGVKSTDTIRVIHIYGPGQVQTLNATAYDNYFTFTTSNFSPFGFVIERSGGGDGGNNDGSGNDGGAQTGGTTTTPTTPRSPQTGVYA